MPKTSTFALSDTKIAQLREVAGILLLVFSAFGFVSLWTFHPGDTGGHVYPFNEAIHNAGGRLGAALASGLLMDLGLAAYFLVALAAFWGGTIFLDRPVRQFALKAFGVIVFIVASSTLLALLRPPVAAGATGALWHAVGRGGGLFGDWMARGLTTYCGTVGAFLALLLATSVSILLATDWLIYSLVCKLGSVAWTGGAFARKFAAIGFDHYRAWRDARAAARDSDGRRRRIEELANAQRMRDAKKSSREMPAIVLSKPAAAAAPIEFAGATAIAEPPSTRTSPQEIPVAPVVRRAPGGETPASPPPRHTDGGQARRTPPPPRPAPTADHGTPKFTPASAHAAPAVAYRLPSLELLDEPAPTRTESDDRDLTDRMMTIEGTLRNFDLESKVVSYEKGPVVTLYELELAPGIRVHKIVGMADDLAIALKAPSVRIIAPIPGKGTIGIEVPNAYTDIVRLKDLFRSGAEAMQKQALPLYLGKDAAGVPIIKDLTDMPHLLIAGTTGSGKSVCLNAIIMSLLLARKPDDLRILLIDPKMVELSAFKEIPHLLAPVVTEMKRAPVVLEWLVRVMEERYSLFARVGVKKIDAFNALGPQKILERVTEEGEEPPDVPTHLPYMVVILDELADMMMVSAKDVESLITRLAQKSRAVGVHMVLATQRPSVDVITGLIKSNMPARIAFKVASKIDSRTILDRNGAERLLGKGDMLWLDPATSNLMRAQCTYVADKEIRDVVKDWREQGDPIFDDSLLEIGATGEGEVGEKDDLFDTAVRIILETQRGSVSLLQRRLEIGYTRAARLVDMMGKAGIVGDYKGSKAREVLMTLEEWDARHGSAGDAGEASSGDDAPAASSSDERIHPGDPGPSQAERMREDADDEFA